MPQLVTLSVGRHHLRCWIPSSPCCCCSCLVDEPEEEFLVPDTAQPDFLGGESWQYDSFYFPEVVQSATRGARGSSASSSDSCSSSSAGLLEGGGGDGSPSSQVGVLGPVIELFRASAVLDLGGEAREVRREPFVQGLEACAEVLNKLGGGMGNYLLTNTRKLRNSKAPVSEDSYGPWLLSEYPVHAATGYRGYVDDSAWMANLWIGWTMEFFVEFFALLSDGQETQQSVDAAYQQTLRAHHGLVQRAAFSAAVRQLPPRQDLLERLRGGAKKVAVERELGDFADIVRPLARFCIRTNEALQQRLQAEHAALTGRRAA